MDLSILKKGHLDCVSSPIQTARGLDRFPESQQNYLNVEAFFFYLKSYIQQQSTVVVA